MIVRGGLEFGRKAQPAFNFHSNFPLQGIGQTQKKI